MEIFDCKDLDCSDFSCMRDMRSTAGTEIRSRETYQTHLSGQFFLTSVGKFILLKIGFNNLVNDVIKLLSTNKDMAIIKVKIVGNKLILIFIPSFTPSIKVLKISTFL